MNTIVVAVVVAFPIAAAVSRAVDTPTGFLTASVLVAAVVIFAARTFHGRQEPIAPPRPWWKMTARPPEGFLLATLFGAQALSVTITRLDGVSLAPTMLPVSVQLLISANYRNASLCMKSKDRAYRSSE
ncbi:hypothetical protein GCM10027057_00870 [Marisediminicola antarctica]